MNESREIRTLTFKLIHFSFFFIPLNLWYFKLTAAKFEFDCRNGTSYGDKIDFRSLNIFDMR